VRTGQVAYRRSYDYNPDGSRAMVIRDDVVNGSHWDVYSYDEVSGRLESVLDVWSGEVNRFVWNPEGTLARWSNNQPNSYARVFGYDEEGRLTRIERDYGNGNLQVAYEYGYNSDGVRVWKRDVPAGQEYRYVCRIGCGGVPMRVYSRAIGSEGWDTLEAYVEAGRVLFYNQFLRIDLEDSEVYHSGAITRYIPLDSDGQALQRLIPCQQQSEPNLGYDICAPAIDDNCVDESTSEIVLTRLGQRPCRPKPRCGYVYAGLECRNIQDILIPDIRCGPWSRWARMANILGYTSVWCRHRVCNRDRIVTQQCRIKWVKNCPPYDTRYSPWRRRICVITETNKQYNCCPGQEQDPNTHGCSSPAEIPGAFIGDWIPGGSTCQWQ